jgi:hypothetical protein
MFLGLTREVVGGQVNDEAIVRQCVPNMHGGHYAPIDMLDRRRQAFPDAAEQGTVGVDVRKSWPETGAGLDDRLFSLSLKPQDNGFGPIEANCSDAPSNEVLIHY